MTASGAKHLRPPTYMQGMSTMHGSRLSPEGLDWVAGLSHTQKSPQLRPRFPSIATQCSSGVACIRKIASDEFPNSTGPPTTHRCVALIVDWRPILFLHKLWIDDPGWSSVESMDRGPILLEDYSGAGRLLLSLLGAGPQVCLGADAICGADASLQARPYSRAARAITPLSKRE